MKKIGGMMYPKQRARRTQKSYVCKKCGKVLTPSEAYFYVDSCNCAITENSPAYCRECYKERYGE